MIYECLKSSLLKISTSLRTIFFRIRIRKCKAAYGFCGDIFEGRHTRAP